MKNYLVIGHNGKIHVSIEQKAMINLTSCRPEGCPFADYSMFDLLKDWISMYSWQIVQMNKQIALADFIKNIYGDGKVLLYGQAMIDLLMA